MNKNIELFVTILTAVSVLIILAVYALPLSQSQLLDAYIFDLIVVSILAADFYVRLKKSKEGFKFILKNWYEIPAMIPLILFSFIEGQSAIAGATRILRLVRLFRLVHLFFRGLRVFEKSKFLYLLVFSAMVVSFGAIGEYVAESSNAGAKITNLGDAFWWAIVTVTTVGYGDLYPVTVGGKIIASILMIAGIAIIGIFITTLGSALIDSRLNKNKATTISPLTFTDEAKLLIKSKIDGLDNLNSKDVDALLSMIKNLHDSLQKNNSK
ncbi:MAG TPA: ion transporter [Nitrososphaeraceae archaeon]|nr:ion transporter [Nitrososphaeraceae archaeon]